MAIAFVKEVGNGTSATAATTHTVSVLATPGAGSTLIMSIAYTNANASAASATDSRGNTWTRVRAVTNSDTVAIFTTHQDVSALQSGDTVTVSFGATSVSRFSGAIHEFSGVTDVVDVSSTLGTGTLTARDAGSNTTTNANDLIWAAYQVAAATETSFTPGAGYTSPTTAFYNSGGTNPVAVEFQYQIASATGAFDPTATGGASASSSGAFIALKAKLSPTNTVAPVASGTTNVGFSLSTTNGTWTDDGSPTFTYQWQRDVAGNGVYGNISLATSSGYTLVSADAGCNVRCVVTDSTPDGNASVNSNSLGLITNSGVLASPISAHGPNAVSAHSGVTGTTEITQHSGNSGTPIEAHSGVSGYTAVEQH